MNHNASGIKFFPFYRIIMSPTLQFVQFLNWDISSFGISSTSNRDTTSFNNLTLRFYGDLTVCR